MLWPAVSCCVVLCPAVSCCVVLCRAVSCCVLLCPAVSCCVVLCPAVSCCVLLCIIITQYNINIIRMMQLLFVLLSVLLLLLLWATSVFKLPHFTLVEEQKVFKKNCLKAFICTPKAIHIHCTSDKLRTTLYTVFIILISYFVILKTHPLCNPNYNTILRFTSGGISQVNGGVRTREWRRSVSVASL